MAAIRTRSANRLRTQLPEKRPLCGAVSQELDRALVPEEPADIAGKVRNLVHRGENRLRRGRSLCPLRGSATPAQGLVDEGVFIPFPAAAAAAITTYVRSPDRPARSPADKPEQGAYRRHLRPRGVDSAHKLAQT